MLIDTSVPRNPRRSLLRMLPVFAVGGLILALRRERPLPDPAVVGSGPKVKLVFFSDRGEPEAFHRSPKLLHTDAEWKDILSPDEYRITREAGTEFPFQNRYFHKPLQPGLYRCVCCGNAVFRTEDQFDSDTGWPSFTAPIAPENIYTLLDRTLPEERTEVLCSKCDAHLGHVFNDGPPPTGLRYCLNSVALRFVPFF